MKRKSFVAVACAAAMIASMTSGLTVFAEETADFSGEELSILVSAGWMDNRYDATIELGTGRPRNSMLWNHSC